MTIVCRYCDESAEDKDMIEFPLRKVINGEIIILTHVTNAGEELSPFICLECLKGDIEALDGRWIYD